MKVKRSIILNLFALSLAGTLSLTGCSSASTTESLAGATVNCHSGILTGDCSVDGSYCCYYKTAYCVSNNKDGGNFVQSTTASDNTYKGGVCTPFVAVDPCNGVSPAAVSRADDVNGNCPPS